VKTLVLERAGDGVVHVTLNRPAKKNAIDGAMWDELLAVFEEVSASDADRVLVLTGAGDAFCSGADLADESGSGRHQLDQMRHFNAVGLALHQCPKPTLAKVNGIAAGAGLNLALGCDLVVASDRARFSEIFARRALSIDLGGSWLLPRLVGMHRAKELALLADVIDAREAERIGLVNRVVPHAELDALAADWAGRLAAGPPLALAMTKRLLSRAFESSFTDALDAESMAQSVNVATKDTREAFAAFFEKRPPRFQGR
jgi:2-(1,2-epoxy-1,2-dihydrophenyl)acetyl-CoA isomerase